MSAIHLSEAVSEHMAKLDTSQSRDLITSIASATSFDSVQQANKGLQTLTGVVNFFDCNADFEAFKRLIVLPLPLNSVRQIREYGDFQTPPELAGQICSYLASMGIAPEVVIEPTHGLGNFISASLETFPSIKLVYGVEIQEHYIWHLKIELLRKSLNVKQHHAAIQLCHDSIFKHKFSEEVSQAQNILILGNPPWVTNAELGGLGSSNLPKKLNIRELNGLDALTGKSNFDICEFIFIKLLETFSHKQGTFAMLCKNATARNLIEFLGRRKYSVADIRMLKIDALKTFGVSADACLFIMQLGSRQNQFTCQVSSFAEPHTIVSTFGWTDGKSVSDIAHYQHTANLEGRSIFVWRQGIKHDAAKIMELKQMDEQWVNGLDEVVNIETSHIYGLLKSSDLQEFDAATPDRRVIVTQKKIGEPTDPLRIETPQLWAYLNQNIAYFDKRQSVIYKNKPAFSMFGVGDYSFKPYKVAISGLYKHPNFALVLPVYGRPVMLDDTCYFLGFDYYKDAVFTASMLNTESVRQFLLSITFNDAKRPFTKDALMRIDLLNVAKQISFVQLKSYWGDIGYQPLEQITESDFSQYKNTLLAFAAKEKSHQMAFEL